MPATFSINVGTPTEAARLQDIYSVLDNIPDNTSKLIAPKDVRDAIFSVWANSAFKQTSGTASIEYIGIDSNNPTNRDIKQKIFIGKRNVSGVDIMSNSLLSSTNDTDIFLFNTKPDTSSQSVTKISILAGTNSLLYGYAPYIKSEYIGATSGDKLSMDFVNPSLYGGPINVYSSSGRIAINDIIFPTIAESTGSASNGKILRYSGSYPNGSLVWSNDTVSIANIGATGSPTNIYGSPVLINGYPLEFSDANQIPLSVGGIPQGSTFSNVSIVDMLNSILYPYVPPVLYLSVTNLATGTTYAEAGFTSSVVLSYSITKYSYDIADSQILGTTFSGYTFSSSPGGIYFGTVSGSTATPATPFNNGSGTNKEWNLQVSDSLVGNFTYSATASIEYVNPVFSSFSMTSFNLRGSGLPNFIARASGMGSIINSSNKMITAYPGSSHSFLVYYNGSGYLYFLYPNTGYTINSGYSTSVKMIKDPNGYILYDSSTASANFTAFTYSLSTAPTGTIINYPNYICMRSIATCSYPGGYFEFIF